MIVFVITIYLNTYRWLHCICFVWCDTCKLQILVRIGHNFQLKRSIRICKILAESACSFLGRRAPSSLNDIFSSSFNSPQKDTRGENARANRRHRSCFTKKSRVPRWIWRHLRVSIFWRSWFRRYHAYFGTLKVSYVRCVTDHVYNSYPYFGQPKGLTLRSNYEMIRVSKLEIWCLMGQLKHRVCIGDTFKVKIQVIELISSDFGNPVFPYGLW